MHLETARMLLRPFELGDESALHAILSDPVVMTYVEPAYTVGKTAAFLRDFCITRPERAAYAAVHKGEGRMIGYILFKHTGGGVYEMGWFFNREYQGKGYAYEISRELIAYAFNTLAATRLFAETADVDKTSALLKKLGFKHMRVLAGEGRLPDGRQVDMHAYSLTREDYFKL